MKKATNKQPQHKPANDEEFQNFEIRKFYTSQHCNNQLQAGIRGRHARQVGQSPGMTMYELLCFIHFRPTIHRHEYTEAHYVCIQVFNTYNNNNNTNRFDFVSFLLLLLLYESKKLYHFSLLFIIIQVVSIYLLLYFYYQNIY